MLSVHSIILEVAWFSGPRYYDMVSQMSPGTEVRQEDIW